VGVKVSISKKIKKRNRSLGNAREIILVIILIGINTSFSSVFAATSVKTDGTFSGQLVAMDTRVSQRSSGFISSVKLKVKWWGLLGQPVESYSLKWRMSDYINVPSTNATLSRSMLSKYPALLKRFNNLKPHDIQLKIWFGISNNGRKDLNNSTHFNCSLPKIHIVKKDIYSCDNAIGYRIIQHIPHLMIAKSGQWDDNITPSSPRDWNSFIKWKNLLGAKHTNERAAETFKQATAIDFDELEVINVKIPSREINAIYQAYLKKEKNEEEEEDEDKEDDNWLDSDDESADSNNPDESEDDWLDSDDESSGSNNSCESDKESESLNNSDESNDDWLNSDSDMTASNSNSDFMNDMVDCGVNKLNSEAFKIVESKDQTMGVKALDGFILIPFRRWHIISYKKGIAKVLQRSKTEGHRAVECGSFYYGAFSPVTIWLVTDTYERGLVDKSGNWLLPPRKEAFTSSSGGDLGCNDQIVNKVHNSLKAKGYKIIDIYNIDSEERTLYWSIQ
jgi:hypothetical protein